MDRISEKYAFHEWQVRIRVPRTFTVFVIRECDSFRSVIGTITSKRNKQRYKNSNYHCEIDDSSHREDNDEQDDRLCFVELNIMHVTGGAKQRMALVVRSEFEILTVAYETSDFS